MYSCLKCHVNKPGVFKQSCAVVREQYKDLPPTSGDYHASQKGLCVSFDASSPQEDSRVQCTIFAVPPCKSGGVSKASRTSCCSNNTSSTWTNTQLVAGKRFIVLPLGIFMWYLLYKEASRPS